jgi:hypothetical protein
MVDDRTYEYDDAPPQEVMDAAMERRNAEHEREQAEHEHYMAWLADRAERAMDAMPDDEFATMRDALNTVRLDFRNLPPRSLAWGEAGVEEARVPDPRLAEIMDRYGITGEMDAADLLALDIEPPRTIIEGIISAGTTVIASLPKLGKSWMVLQMAVESVLGGTFLDRQVEQGSVLFLPLEDGRGRTQSRLRKVLAGRTLPRGKLTVRWDAPPLGEGMEGLIEEWLDTHPDATMVIVDTLGRVRTPGDGRRNAYQVDVQDVGRLQSLVRDRSVALLLVHHTKKGKEDDFVAQVSGTLGIAGSADTILIVNRKRLVEIGTVEVTSRELPEAEIAVRFTESTWHSAPDALPGASAAKMAVYDAISLHGPLWPVAIGRLLRSERTAVQHHCSSLLQDGAIVRTAAGYATAESVGMQSASTDDDDNPHSIH